MNPMMGGGPMGMGMPPMGPNQFMTGMGAMGNPMGMGSMSGMPAMGN